MVVSQHARKEATAASTAQLRHYLNSSFPDDDAEAPVIERGEAAAVTLCTCDDYGTGGA